MDSLINFLIISHNGPSLSQLLRRMGMKQSEVRTSVIFEEASHELICYSNKIYCAELHCVHEAIN